MLCSFNYTTRKTTLKMLIRKILHNGLNLLEDIELEWITPCNLKIWAAFPDWFQMAEQMAQFTLDDQGNMFFLPKHALTTDVSECNHAVVEEDNKIWNCGHLEFQQDMKTDDPFYELLDVQIASCAVVVKMLQIVVE